MARRKSKSTPRADEVGAIVPGDDGLPASVVNEWTGDKHYLLREYLNLQSYARRKYLRDFRQGATYIDLFCGAGRSKVLGENRFIEGSAVLAWNSSIKKHTPFSAVYIADENDVLRNACEQRLRKLGAPVVVIDGNALEAVTEVCNDLNNYWLHFALLDPFNLESLNLEIIRRLANFGHIDILVHLSAMDLFRNAERCLTADENRFEGFAPGWTESVNRKGTRDEIFRGLVEYWQRLMGTVGMETTKRFHPMKNNNGLLIYWLLLLYRNPLAEKFWNIVLHHQPNYTPDFFYTDAG